MTFIQNIPLQGFYKIILSHQNDFEIDQISYSKKRSIQISLGEGFTKIIKKLGDEYIQRSGFKGYLYRDRRIEIENYRAALN